MTAPATVDQFKEQFDRDFVYGTGMDSVRDSDIQKGFDEAEMCWNEDLWTSSTEKRVSFLFAAAHFMVSNIQAAGGLQGVNKGLGVRNRGGVITAAKSVGQVSHTAAIPQSILEDRILSQFMKTDYGYRYLELLSPRLVGNILIVPGYCDTGGPNAPS